MTTFERFEREIPQLMGDLAPTRMPDYIDDMLQATARTRQRPAWSALERWLPMGVIAQTQTMRPVPWRPVVILALLALLVLGGAMFYAGSQPRVPAPFGVAANGVIVFGTTEGDIMRADPRTGKVTPLIAGPDVDSNPWFSNDGTKFAFDRQTEAVYRALFIADTDGSGVRQLLDADAEITWFDWSASGDRFTLSRVDDRYGTVTIVDASDGRSTTFTAGMTVSQPMWRPGHDQLVITGETSGPDGLERGFYLVDPDGTGLMPIVRGTDIINEPTLSPDGTKLAYSTWSDGAEGRTHVVDIDTGVQLPLDVAADGEYTDLSPIFAPDGTRLLVERYEIHGYRPTVLPFGGGSAIALGAPHPEMTDGARSIFSPDGTKVLVTYQDDGTTWLYDLATGDGEQQPWEIPLGSSGTWQRTAP